MSASLAPIHDLQTFAFPVTSRTTWIFVRVCDAEGREGLGEATLEGRAAEVQAAILRHRQDLLGRRFDAGAEAARWACARLPAGDELIEAAAISGIEQALQDLCAGAVGLRLADALGPVLRDPVPMYANINRGTTTRQPGQFAERALRAARIGFAGIKIAPFDGLTPELADSAEGRPLIDAGLERIAAVRQALDADGFRQRSLMVDCHWRFSVRAAQALIAELAALGVDWYECPIPEEASFHPALLSLRSAANQRGMRLAGAELMIGTQGFMAILRAGLYDVVMPDVKYAGGLEETLRIAALAERFGTACSPHNPSGPVCHAHSLHVASVIPNMPLLEVQFEETERFTAIADARLPAFIDGASAIPSGPGLGVGLRSGSNFRSVTMNLITITQQIRRGLALAILAQALLLGGSAFAQDYPSRAVRIIVPSPPGDGSDLIARSIAQRLSEDWGKPVVVENRAGAGGRIGTETAVKAANDGYTLLMGNAGANGINAAIYPNLPYRLETDFDPITQVIRAPNVLVVNPALGVKTVGELIALFKAQPGKFAYASGGVGSSAHLSAELFKLMAGVDLLHVPYKGAGGALNGVITGDVVMFLGNLPPAVPHIRAGRLQALGVTSLGRSPMLPDAPTLHETGLKDFETIAWFGLFAPVGAPKPVIDRIHQSVVRAVALPETRELFEKIGGAPVANSPAEFRAIVLADIAKWRRVVAASGITGQ